MEATRPPVLVVGAGCTGLALAQGLKHAGIPCIVFERSDALQPANTRDWNMGLHWAAPVLEKLVGPEIWAQMHSTSVDPHTPMKTLDHLKFYNGSTGEQMGNGIPVPHWHRLRRSKLRDLLSQGLDVRFGKKLSNISYADLGDGGSVTASFEDGTRQEGCLLIGVDGARSKTRQLITKPEAAQNLRLPFVATFVHSRYTREQALFLRSFHSLYLASPHPHGRFAFFGMQDAADPGKPETWTFFFYISWPSSLAEQDKEISTFTNADRLKQVKEMGKEYAEPWKSAFKWLPEDHPCWYLGLNVWDPSDPKHSWQNHSGRVTLAGDAAHPMTYQRGQGLNHSLTDAGKLVDAIVSSAGKPGPMDCKAKSAQEAAIEAYETEMIARAGEEVRLSVINTTMLHDWAKCIESPVMKGGMAANK